ncbi:unnamed protein product, partial [marine sediment metagenome]
MPFFLISSSFEHANRSSPSNADGSLIWEERNLCNSLRRLSDKEKILAFPLEKGIIGSILFIDSQVLFDSFPFSQSFKIFSAVLLKFLLIKISAAMTEA